VISSTTDLLLLLTVPSVTIANLTPVEKGSAYCSLLQQPASSTSKPWHCHMQKQQTGDHNMLSLTQETPCPAHPLKYQSFTNAADTALCGLVERKRASLSTCLQWTVPASPARLTLAAVEVMLHRINQLVAVDWRQTPASSWVNMILSIDHEAGCCLTVSS